MSKTVIKERLINYCMFAILLVLLVLSLLSNNNEKQKNKENDDLKEKVVVYLLDNEYSMDEDGCYKKKYYFTGILNSYCKAEGGSCETFKTDSLSNLYERLCIEKGFYEVNKIVKLSTYDKTKDYAFVPQYLQLRYYYKNSTRILVLQGDYRGVNDSKESYHISVGKLGNNLYSDNYKQKYLNLDFHAIDPYFYQSNDNQWYLNLWDNEENYFLLYKLETDLNVDWRQLSEWID